MFQKNVSTVLVQNSESQLDSVQLQTLMAFIWQNIFQNKIWENIRLSKCWQNFHFRWTIPLIAHYKTVILKVAFQKILLLWSEEHVSLNGMTLLCECMQSRHLEVLACAPPGSTQPCSSRCQRRLSDEMPSALVLVFANSCVCQRADPYWAAVKAISSSHNK